MTDMKHSSVRDLMSLSLIVAQSFVFSGCMQQYHVADEHVKALDKRMKQVEKEASNTKVSRRNVEASSSGDE